MKKTLFKKFRVPNWFIRPSQAIASLIGVSFVAITINLLIEKNINKFIIVLFIGWLVAMGMITIFNFLEER